MFGRWVDNGWVYDKVPTPSPLSAQSMPNKMTITKPGKQKNILNLHFEKRVVANARSNKILVRTETVIVNIIILEKILSDLRKLERKKSGG